MTPKKPALCGETQCGETQAGERAVSSANKDDAPSVPSPTLVASDAKPVPEA